MIRLSRYAIPLFFSYVLISFIFCPQARGQKVAVKTNTLYWATTTPNLGLEIGLGPRTSLDVSGGYNPFRFGSKDSNKKFQHWIVQPEFRLWNCGRFYRGFWGFHAMYGKYNAGNISLPLNLISGLKTHRYEGWLVGAGVSYGYHIYLGPHWNLEATFGFGYAYLDYKRFECVRCGDYKNKESKHYFGPTKLGISFVYLFNYKSRR